MNEAKHTPGPWCAYEDIVLFGRTHYGAGIHGTKKAVALTGLYGADDSNESIANARLIAAAPELLEACKNLLTLTQLIANEVYDDESLVEFEVFNEITKHTRWLVLVDELAKAGAAIAKATGAHHD